MDLILNYKNFDKNRYVTLIDNYNNFIKVPVIYDEAISKPKGIIAFGTFYIIDSNLNRNTEFYQKLFDEVNCKTINKDVAYTTPFAILYNYYFLFGSKVLFKFQKPKNDEPYLFSNNNSFMSKYLNVSGKYIETRLNDLSKSFNLSIEYYEHYFTDSLNDIYSVDLAKKIIYINVRLCSFNLDIIDTVLYLILMKIKYKNRLSFEKQSLIISSYSPNYSYHLKFLREGNYKGILESTISNIDRQTVVFDENGDNKVIKRTRGRPKKNSIEVNRA